MVGMGEDWNNKGLLWHPDTLDSPGVLTVFSFQRKINSISLFGETKTRKANKGNISLSFAVSQILSSVLFGGNTRWGRQNLEGSPHYFLPKTQAAHRERGREHWDKKKTGRGQSEGLSFGCHELPVYCWVQWFVVVVAVSVRKRETLFLVLCVRVNLNKTLK